MFYFPKVTSIFGHPWQTKFRGKLKATAEAKKVPHSTQKLGKICYLTPIQ